MRLRHYLLLFLCSFLLFPFPVSAQNFSHSGQHLLSSHQISLENRYPVKSVSAVFKDNILLNLAYLRGDKIDPKHVNWGSLQQSGFVRFILKPGQTFAFSEDVISGYKSTLIKTTNTHFNFEEGFKSDGYLYGDGVCHLASLMFWTATEAGLFTEAPSNHDFYPIPEIPMQYGVSIFYQQGSHITNSAHNLYITNGFTKTVAFEFEYDRKILTSSVYQSIF